MSISSGSKCNANGSSSCDHLGACTCKEEYNGTNCNSCSFLHFPTKRAGEPVNSLTGQGVLCESKLLSIS